MSIIVKDAFGNDVEKTIKLNVSRSGDVMINGREASKNKTIPQP